MQHTWVARAGGAAGAADRISPDGVARALGSSLRAFCARTHRSSAFMSPRLLSHKGLASYDSASAGGTRARLEKRAAARKRHGMTRTGMGATLRQRRVAIGDQGNLLCNFAGVPTHHSNYGRHQPGDRRPRGRDAGATAAIAFQGGHNRLSGQAFCRTLRRRRDEHTTSLQPELSYEAPSPHLAQDRPRVKRPCLAGAGPCGPRRWSGKAAVCAWLVLAGRGRRRPELPNFLCNLIFAGAAASAMV